MMKKAALLFLFLAYALVSRSQSTAIPDTFMVNESRFVATTPTDWYSTKIQNGTQQDTSWNYRMQYVPIGSTAKIYAEIAVQIVDDTINYTPSKKEQRQFEKRCTVTQKVFSGWEGYCLDYKPQRPKGCLSCAPIYSRLYTFVLSKDKTLNIVFVGQATRAEIIPLLNTLDIFANEFVSNNFESMIDFGLINFSAPILMDTFHIQDYRLNILIPQDYFIQRMAADGKDGYDLMSDNGDVSISVSAVYYDREDSANHLIPYADTNIVFSKNYNGTQNYHGFNVVQTTPITVQTMRKIELRDGGCIMLTFKTSLGYSDKASVGRALSRYANLMLQENLYPRRQLVPATLPKVDVGRPKNDLLKPKKNNNILPK